MNSLVLQTNRIQSSQLDKSFSVEHPGVSYISTPRIRSFAFSFSTPNKTQSSHFFISSLSAQILEAASSTPPIVACLAHVPCSLECHMKLWNLLSCKYILPLSLQLPHILGFPKPLKHQRGRGLSEVQATVVWWHHSSQDLAESNSTISNPSITQRSHLLGTCHCDHAWFPSWALLPTLLSCKDIIWDELWVDRYTFISVLTSF